MSNTFSPDALRTVTEQLLDVLETARDKLTPRTLQLDDAIHDAQAWLHRRAARNKIDRASYRLGSAFRCQDGLDLDDVALCGLDHLGAHGLTLLVALGVKHPDDPLSGLMRRLFRSPAGAHVRAWGVWTRWHWLRDLYRHQVEAFVTSEKGVDPIATWRGKKPTPEQGYLIMELARYLRIEKPEPDTRWDAHTWLLRSGGNPRFLERPELPPLPTIEECFG